ncbi:MAG: GntR family transcriptional regulator [Salinarimonadaceae bacterium]|nr:MAG: GntR family transcriptional regulator [Salinarimonadaceae bacterium]
MADSMPDVSTSIVDRIHAQVRRMAIRYELMPGERLNEGELSRKLGVSRTPLREALNRLNSEGFLSFEPGKGFFCRRLDPKTIFDLYEARKLIETSAIQLSVVRATSAQIADLQDFLDSTGPEALGKSTDEMVELDEIFHERLIALSGNQEMIHFLRGINARIQFIRFLDFDGADRPKTQAEHQLVLEMLRRRDVVECVKVLERHIDRRLDQITEVVRKGIAELYLKA